MRLSLYIIFLLTSATASAQRTIIDLNKGWQFHLFDSTKPNEFSPGAQLEWRTVNLPHDWSIESNFNQKFPATTQGGALPGGIALYKKVFRMPASAAGKMVFIEFDGVY